MLKVARKLCTALAFCLPLSLGFAQTTSSPAEIVEAVRLVRIRVLGDSTPIDFCGVRELWANDTLLAPRFTVPRLQFARVSECPASGSERAAAYSGMPLVHIGAIRAFPDSVVVTGSTQRGPLGRAEVYVWDTRQGGLRFKEFRITAYSVAN